MSHLHYSIKSRGLSMAELNSAKAQSLKLAKDLQAIYQESNQEKYASMAGRVRYCSTFWQGFYCAKCGKFHQMHTTGCKHRLCPICAVRSARVVAVQAMEAIEDISSRYPSSICSLLTLTQKNVDGRNLCSTIDSMLSAWQKLRHIRRFNREIIGWARTIEIIPALDDISYHPHIHAIIVHEPNAEVSMNGAWWSNSWRDCMGLDYQPIVDVRQIEDRQGAVYEVSKYVSKLSRIYGSQNELNHVKYIGDAMYNRQLRTYGGEWLKARRNLNQLAVEKMDDDAISEYGELATDKCAICNTQMTAVCLSWSGLTYLFDHEIPVQGVEVANL